MKRNVFLAGSAALFAGLGGRATAASFVPLNGAHDPFRNAFNRARDNVRVVMLGSPVCPLCLRGFSEVQHGLFDHINDRKLTGFAVWDPQLGAKVGNVPEAAGLLPDPRIRQYWDGSDGVGVAYEQVLPTPGTSAWDVYMLYAPGVTWSEKAPPKPTFWMHQLGLRNAPELDIDVFADRARQLLQRAG